ncbi:hypothetical protein [Arthrobacter sp. NA-172]|uniref:hypothetical protein n=1 Tax=Arthrobacter sp. NA-172 TaxID=3367524 RepID=UPI003754D7CD
MSNCTCHPVENPWTYYGAVEPGGAMEPNPDCPEHFPSAVVNEYPRYASIKVVDGPTTSFLIAERVRGGWQSGVMNYPDSIVERFTPLAVHTAEEVEEGLRHVKAEALREAADEWEAYIRAMNFGTTYPIDWLRARADRVEGG